jgi:hypothetical protein
MAQKSMGYGVEHAESEYGIGLSRFNGIKIVELVGKLLIQKISARH